MKKDLYFISILKKELNRLKNLHLDLISSTDWKIEGTLNIGRKYNKAQYYVYTKEDKKRKYLRKSDVETAQKLAQKSYGKKISDKIEERIVMIEKILKTYGNPLEQCYESLCDERKYLVSPIFVDDETFIKNWYEENQGFQNKHPYTQTFYTNKGEAVRSKSEKIIADILYKYDIPYVYEPMLVINGQYKSPDFLLLNIFTREESIYEHFGMVDDADYMNKAVEKVNDYQRAGYILGKNLLMSMETRDNPLDIKAVEKMILANFSIT